MLRPSLILLSSLLAAQMAMAQGTAGKTAAPPNAQTAATESQQLARTKLMEMAKFLGGTEKFSTRLRVGYEVVQDSGQKIEFGEIREISVQRPNRVRVEEVASHGGRDLTLFDGKSIIQLHGDSGVYAKAPQPGNIDATMQYFVRDLNMRLPLAAMLISRFPDELQRRVQSVDYVERTTIMGKSAHHIAARTANVDFQVWIAEGTTPLPLRIVLTYRLEAGQPQFWADFSKWNLAPAFAKSTFEFKPPQGAKQIAFAAQFRTAEQAQADKAQAQGGKQ